jgi:hypothetical protein
MDFYRSTKEKMNTFAIVCCLVEIQQGKETAIAKSKRRINCPARLTFAAFHKYEQQLIPARGRRA